MAQESKEGVDGVLEEAAKAAADKAAKEQADAKAKADQEAKDSQDKKPEQETKSPQKSLDELIKDPKIREQIKSMRGWSDSQLDSAYQMAPMQEEMARLKTEKKYADFESHREFIDKELEKIAIFDRTPQVMERLYWMAKGKSAIENPEKKGQEKKRDVVAERIHSPYPPPSGGSGESGGGSGAALSEEEKFMADRLGVSYDRYEKSKKGNRPDRPDSRKYIRPPEPFKVPQGGNTADHALGVLMRPRRS